MCLRLQFNREFIFACVPIDMYEKTTINLRTVKEKHAKITKQFHFTSLYIVYLQLII